MASQIKSIVSFVAVAPAATALLPHGLNVDGLGVIPDELTPGAQDFTVTADATNVSVTNEGLVAANINVLAEWWHTENRVFGDAAVTNLTPRPFVGAGAGAGVDTDEQVFRFTAAGGEGSDFFVALPAARASDVYAIAFSQVDMAAILGFRFPDTAGADRTTAQFRVITTAALTAGDIIDFRVVNR